METYKNEYLIAHLGYPLPSALADGLKANMLLALATIIWAKAPGFYLPSSVG